MEDIRRMHDVGHPRRYSKNMTSLQCEPEHFDDRIIFMSMYNDIFFGENEQTQKIVDTIHRQLQIRLATSLESWSFLEFGSEEKWYGTYTAKLDGSLDQTAVIRWQISQDPVVQYFVPPVLLREENYEANEGALILSTSMVVMKASSCFSAR